MRSILVAFTIAMLMPASSDAQTEYTVGPQDLLAITVWDQPDLAGKYTVETDGTIGFPLIGRVLHLPSWVWHKAEALEDTLDVDVFSPPSEDWLNKTDAYLRR